MENADARHGFQRPALAPPADDRDAAAAPPAVDAADSEQRYRNIVDGLAEMVCRFRIDGTILFANEAYARTVGADLAALRGRSFWEFIPVGEHEAIRAMLAGLTPAHPEVRIENRFETTAGTRWMLWTNRGILFDAAGHVVEAQSTGIDLTDLRRTTEALRDSEARLRALVRTSTDVVFRASADWGEIQPLDGRGLVASNAAPTQDWLARNVPATDRAGLAAAIAEATRRVHAFELEHRVIREDGSIGWALSRAVPILDEGGAIIEWFGAASDITDRKLAEDAVREREERFRTLADAMPQIVYVTRPDGVTEYVNAQWKAYTGLDEAGLAALAATVHPADLDGLIGAWAQHSAAGETYSREFRLRRADGAYRWFLTRLRPVLDPDGRIDRWYGTSTDIHDIKLAREALEFAKEQAEAASIAKDHFLATLSHELRTPLTPALAALSLWDGAAEVEPPALREDLALIGRNLALEARLIDDLLDLTRIVRGKLALRLETVDVQALVDAVLDMYQAEAGAKDVVLVAHTNADTCLVQADPGRLQQVFWNLLKNAVKFTPPGGRVQVSTRIVSDRLVEVEVSDNGAGMTTDTLARIFRPFEQGSAEHARRHGGLGLGLAISRALVEAHGGAIAAYSEGPDRGSRFVVSFFCQVPSQAPSGPLARFAETTAPSSGAAEAPPSGLRVLLVEDHEDSAEMMARILSVYRHDVTAVSSVAAAQAALRARGPQGFDLILSDLGLPDGSGMDVVRFARERLQMTIPAIAVTGYGMDADVARAYEAGFDLHLTKPVNVLQVNDAVARLTRNRT